MSRQVRNNFQLLQVDTLEQAKIVMDDMLKAVFEVMESETINLTFRVAPSEYYEGYCEFRLAAFDDVL